MESNKQLGYLLNKSLRIFRSQLVAELRKEGIDLSFEQYVMIRMLESNCDMIQQDLADILQKDKSIIVRQINALLDDQIIDRVTNAEDKRKKNLTLTNKGQELSNQLTSISTDLSEKLLSGISESDYTTFKKVILKIQENGTIEA